MIFKYILRCLFVLSDGSRKSCGLAQAVFFHSFHNLKFGIDIYKARYDSKGCRNALVIVAPLGRFGIIVPFQALQLPVYLGRPFTPPCVRHVTLAIMNLRHTRTSKLPSV